MTFTRTFLGAALTALALSSTAIAGDGALGVYLTEDDGSRGALVEEVAANSAAARADLRKGDRIVKCDGKKTPNGTALIRHLVDGNAGQVLKLRVNRDGWEKTIRVTLAPKTNTKKAAPKSTRQAPSSGERGFLGIYLRQNESGAAVVDGVMEGSPAAKGGLKVGDTITSVGKRAVSDPSALITAVSQYGVGDQLNFKVSRRGANKTVAVTLGRRPAEGSPPPAPAAPAKPAPAPSTAGKARPYIGIALIDSEGKGPLTVDDVQAGSPGERFGLRPQDVIVSANGTSLKTIEDFVQLMGKLSAGDSVQFKIERDGWKSDVRVTLGTAK